MAKRSRSRTTQLGLLQSLYAKGHLTEAAYRAALVELGIEPDTILGQSSKVEHPSDSGQSDRATYQVTLSMGSSIEPRCTLTS